MRELLFMDLILMAPIFKECISKEYISLKRCYQLIYFITDSTDRNVTHLRRVTKL